MKHYRRSAILFSILIMILASSIAPGLAAGPQSDRRRGADEADPVEINSPQSELRGMIKRYMADRGSLFRFHAVETSPARNARMRQFYTEWLAALGRVNFDSLSQDGRINYLLFKNHLDYELRQLEIRAKAFADAAPLIPFAIKIVELEDARRQMKRVEPASVAAMLNGLSKEIDAARRAVEAGPGAEAASGANEASVRTKKTVANRAAVIIGQLRNTLKNWFGFYNGYDPMFTWWASEPYKAVDKSLENYAVLLRERIVGVKAGDQTAIIGDPIGREALISELAHEMIPYTPEELIAIATREMEWCEAEMRRASRDLGYGDDWRKALEHVKTLYVEPGKQPDLIRELAVEAIDFVEKHDLITVPQLARDTWRMEMLSPEQQLVSPFFLGGEIIQVSYPTAAMGHEQKMMSMRGNNIHFARATVFHELIPGHHLQGFMAARHRTHRSLFSTPFWTEGWALYWEMLLWDMSFAKSAENRIGMLFWRMHRSARIMFLSAFTLSK